MTNKPRLYLATKSLHYRQHLLAHRWLGGGGQLFKCDRWSLVSGCCCLLCSFHRLPSRPQRAWDEPLPQYSSAEKPFVVVQFVFRRKANGPPLLFVCWILWRLFLIKLTITLQRRGRNLKSSHVDSLNLQCGI